MANTPPTPQVPDLARDSDKAYSQTHFVIKLVETEVSYLRFNDPMLKFSGPLEASSASTPTRTLFQVTSKVVRLFLGLGR